MKLGNLKKDATSFLDQYKNESPAAYAAAQQAIGGLLILDGFIGIDNPLGDKKRPGIFGSLAGVFAGLILAFLPSFIGNAMGVNKMTGTTTATIVSTSQHQSATTNSDGSQQTSTTCSAIAKYVVNGKEYTQGSSMSSGGMCSYASGQAVQIYYNPDNPGQWGTDVKTIGMVLNAFLVVSIIVIITSLFTFVVRLLSIIFGWKLLKSGRDLAKTLPEGTDLTTVKKEIERTFKTSLFGFGVGGAAAQPLPVQTLQNQPVAPMSQIAAPQSPTTPQPTMPSQVAPTPEAPNPSTPQDR